MPIASFSFAIFSFLLAAAPSLPTLTADLDGNGSIEAAVAEASDGWGRLRILDANGALLAEASFPVPDGRHPRIALSAGPLGSAGALLSLEAFSRSSRCGSIWRYREETLTRVPIAVAAVPLPDCASREDWSYRWERPAADAPALLVRERSRPRPNGIHHEIEFFRYTGFRLELDTQRSVAEIGGVAIPAWSDPVLYRKETLDHLSDRFDLSPFRSQPRLRIVADRAQGLFAVNVSEGRRERSLPITGFARGEGGNDVTLTAGAAPRTARIRVALSSDGKIPIQAVVAGMGERYDSVYAPVTRPHETAIQLFSSAEQELAENFLPGAWSGEEGQPLEVVAIAGSSPIVRFGKPEVRLDIDRAPARTDILLVPRDGSPPSTAILLRGPNSIQEVVLRCRNAERGKGEFACEAEGRGKVWRRQGARVNVR